MNEMTLLKAISDIDDAYIEEALPASLEIKKKRSGWLNLRMLAAAACVLIAAVFSVRYFGNNDLTPAGTDPIVTTGGVDEASDITGFSMDIPDTYLDSDEPVIQVIDGTILEASYRTGDEEIMYIRKAKGSDDISGDYNEYGNETVLILEQVNIICKGNDGLWNLITWTKDGYTYAVGIPGGIDTDGVTELVSQIN